MLWHNVSVGVTGKKNRRKQPPFTFPHKPPPPKMVSLQKISAVYLPETPSCRGCFCEPNSWDIMKLSGTCSPIACLPPPHVPPFFLQKPLLPKWLQTPEKQRTGSRFIIRWVNGFFCVYWVRPCHLAVIFW